MQARALFFAVGLLVLWLGSAVGLAQPAVFDVDCSEAPDLKGWGERAKSICEEWYPKIGASLASDGFTPPASVKIVFKKDMKVPAATSRGVISINAEYVGKHKDDFGMVVHELTHVVQSYPRNKAVDENGKHADMGWLVEGIADYVRFFQYEPQTKVRVDPKRARHRDGYRVTAAFLDFLVRTHDPEIVKKLNAALRAGDCGEGKFKEITGKGVEDLWKEFVATLPAREKPQEKGSEKPAEKPADRPSGK